MTHAFPTRRSSPAAFIGAVGLVLAMAAPVAAAPAGSAAAAGVPADHIDPDDCEEISTDGAGNILVNGTSFTAAQLPDPGFSSTPALLRLAANAAGHPNADVCLDVEATGETITISGHIALCGEVTFEREPPPETPPPATEDPSAPPILGRASTTVDGVAIDDRLLAVDSYAALEVAAAAGVEACFFTTLVRNDAWQHTISTVCTTARLEDDGRLVLSIGGDAYRLSPAEIIDPDAELEIGTDVQAALEIGTLKDDVIHLVTMTITVVEPAACSPDAPRPTPPPAPIPEPPISGGDGIGAGGGGDLGEAGGADSQPALLAIFLLTLVLGVLIALAVWLFRSA